MGSTGELMMEMVRLPCICSFCRYFIGINMKLPFTEWVQLTSRVYCHALLPILSYPLLLAHFSRKN